MPITVDIPLDTPPASPIHSPNGLVMTYDPLTPPRRAGSPSVPARLITPLNVETPWNTQDLDRVQRFFLSCFSGTTYSLGGFSFYAATQTRDLIGRSYLIGMGTALTFIATYTTYLCICRR